MGISDLKYGLYSHCIHTGTGGQVFLEEKEVEIYWTDIIGTLCREVLTDHLLRNNYC